MHRFAALLLLSLSLASCGKWPPIVNSANDIRNLSPDVPSIRARGLADHDLHALVHLESLRDLDFAGGWAVKEAKITDEGLLTLSRLAPPRLESLDFGHNKNITDEGVVHLVKMTSVKWLHLSACPNITDRGLGSLSAMDTLESLDLRGCNGITDKGLVHLVKMQNLKQVDLGGCEKITLEAVQDLGKRMPQAKVEKDDEEWAWHGQR